MGRTAPVFLGAIRVGTLQEGDDGLIELRVDAAYLSMPQRPVLGQWFEDRPGRPQRGERPGLLPPFFANFIPEGDLRLLLEERLAIPHGDDFALLQEVGRDLPGAVEVHPADGTAADWPGVRHPDTSSDEPAIASDGLHSGGTGRRSQCCEPTRRSSNAI